MWCFLIGRLVWAVVLVCWGAMLVTSRLTPTSVIRVGWISRRRNPTVDSDRGAVNLIHFSNLGTVLAIEH